MFEKDHLENWLTSIGRQISENTFIYLIGGCALSFKGLKERTKDIDVVVISKGAFTNLDLAMLKAGFTPETDLTDEFYLTALAVYKKEDSRIDIFLHKVGQMLSFTSGMKKRSTLYRTYGKLKVYLVSNEDIFLFKSMTPRPGDITDCQILIQTGLDWKAVLEEIAKQSKDENKWFFWTFEKVCLIENESNISIPIKAKLLELVKRHWQHRPADFMAGVKDAERHLSKMHSAFHPVSDRWRITQYAHRLPGKALAQEGHACPSVQKNAVFLAPKRNRPERSEHPTGL